MKKIVLVLFLVAILSVGVSAEEISVETSAKIKYTIQASFKIPEHTKVTDINITEPLILEDYRQKIEDMNVVLVCGPDGQETETGCGQIRFEIQDTNIGKQIHIFGKKPPESIKYTAHVELDTTYTEPVISSTISATQNESEYTSATQNIEVDSEVRALAESITTKTNTLDEIIDITSWVHKNIQYNLEFGKVERTAKQTITERQGTCDEIANVEIALLRAKKIPARYISGFAYSGTAWERHAWVEALVAGVWVPIDPTFYQIGHIDVNHFAISKTADYADSSSRILWHAEGKVPPISKTVDNIDLYSDSTKSPLFDAQINIPAVVTYTQDFTVELTISNTQEQYFVIPTTLYIGDSFTYLSNKEKVLVLAPHITKTNWRLRAPPKDTKTYLYEVKIKVLDEILTTHIKTKPVEEKSTTLESPTEEIPWAYIVAGVGSLIAIIVIKVIMGLKHAH